MLQIITLPEKQKYHITSRSSKLSRKQRFLAAFDILIEESFYLLREKESKLFFSRTKGRLHYNTFNEQQKCQVTHIYTVEEKQKYNITFFARKKYRITSRSSKLS